MGERENGWYRVQIESNFPQLMFYEDGYWYGGGFGIRFEDCDVDGKDSKMIMTPSGELVYHGAEHDPVYNTQQEG